MTAFFILSMILLSVFLLGLLGWYFFFSSDFVKPRMLAFLPLLPCYHAIFGVLAGVFKPPSFPEAFAALLSAIYVLISFSTMSMKPRFELFPGENLPDLSLFSSDLLEVCDRISQS